MAANTTNRFYGPQPLKNIAVYLCLLLLPVFFMGSAIITNYPLENFNQASSSAYRDRVEKEFNIRKGKKLEIDLKTGGQIEITGWDKDKVYVKAVSGGGFNDSELDFKETSYGLQISSGYSDGFNSGSVNLRINVPKEFNLSLETMGGDITLKNIEGELTGKTMGGELNLSGLKGKLGLTTMGGEIMLANSDVDGFVHTMGGKVTLEDVTGDVKGTSMGGNVSLKNVTKRNGESTSDKVIISSMGGDIDVDNAPSGADVNTMGGDIKIKSAAKFVKAKTMGGDIIINAVDGAVKATTMGGDVNVKVTGSGSDNKDVTLTSMSGDIYLTVPADFPMNVEIVLAYTDDYDDTRFKIVNDFNLKEERSTEWDVGKGGGSPRKYIYGSGITGDGKNKVKIETINGNVYLKRG